MECEVAVLSCSGGRLAAAMMNYLLTVFYSFVFPLQFCSLPFIYSPFIISHQMSLLLFPALLIEYSIVFLSTH